MEKNKCSLQFVKTLVDFLKGAETVLNQLKLFDRSIRIWWLKHRLTYKKQVYERDKKNPQVRRLLKDIETLKSKSMLVLTKCWNAQNNKNLTYDNLI